ncbi:hypothetical protein CC1G_08403 [Coprinopsis cinerea okayama7|uniref:Uncharacterized protein n=1 Tax=Coprinopsis cinerea (strain Okayama-7 / 130 / ATCC MYA-4618 / FGSC 9003) TaxID=240176 RepID=A8NAN4_COPC7|nr:hypothetical protein CC1G_08403 [Coprinopsis cinerea okayama7\|eukprot:XP_001831886.2 hypothetical protein CC1G_08403 [Coprinopsis cinerea okayama7\
MQHLTGWSESPYFTSIMQTLIAFGGSGSTSIPQSVSTISLAHPRRLTLVNSQIKCISDQLKKKDWEG